MGSWPQVGAILELDSSLPARPGDWLGSRHWHHGGSGVLVGRRFVLTISHVVESNPHPASRAAFLPGVGPIEVVALHRQEPFSDCLMLLELTRDVTELTPLPASCVPIQSVTSPTLVGFGDWYDRTKIAAARGVQRALWPLLDATQARREFRWMANRPETHRVGNANSGGPLVEWRPSGETVVGIVRENYGNPAALDTTTAATWIDRDSSDWIRQLVGEVKPGPAPTCFWHNSPLRTGQLIGPFAVPPGAGRAVATLSVSWLGSGYLNMQMRLVQGPAPAQLLIDLSQDTTSAGRFIARSLELEGNSEVWVAVAPLFPLKAPVTAQLCLRFE